MQQGRGKGGSVRGFAEKARVGERKKMAGGGVTQERLRAGVPGTTGIH